MKISEHWLRAWINPDCSIHQLAQQLCMLGIEVEALEAQSVSYNGVVIGKIRTVHPHPNADTLNVLTVDAGAEQPYTIVCGAKNCAVGMTVACALPGAQLPGFPELLQVRIIRGIPSHGMLCATQELGYPHSEGIASLGTTQAPGTLLSDHLPKHQNCFTLAIPPNRGDCLSAHGIAREIATQYPNTPLRADPIPVFPTHDGISYPVHIEASKQVRLYRTQSIRGVHLNQTTPFWIWQRLIVAGIPSVNIAVDILNYVMLDRGQPLHAFDQDALQGPLIARMAQAQESMTLLSNQTLSLHSNTLVIADAGGPVALAGIMGGMRAKVKSSTQTLLIESACFERTSIDETARHYQLLTESAIRFGRGVDATQAERALAEGVALILRYCGGEAGPVQAHQTHVVSHFDPILFNPEAVESKLGLALTTDVILKTLWAIGAQVQPSAEKLQVTPPHWRHDLRIAEDLLEEIARVVGYNHVPESTPSAPLIPKKASQRLSDSVQAYWVGKGYHEVITYSFIDPKRHALLFPTSSALELPDPITTTMASMRTSLLPGLLEVIRYNQARQQERIQIFEVGNCFLPKSCDRDGGYTLEEKRLAGALAVRETTKEWDGTLDTPQDFFRLKADVLGYLERKMGAADRQLRLGATDQIAWGHPGKSGNLYFQDQHVGAIAALHPRLFKALDLKGPIYLFELQWSFLEKLPVATTIQIPSRFPQVRRDLSVLVDPSITAQAVITVGQEALQGESFSYRIQIFDCYSLPEEGGHKKSIALSIYLQSSRRTLTEAEIQQAIKKVEGALERILGAQLRTEQMRRP